MTTSTYKLDLQSTARIPSNANAHIASIATDLKAEAPSASEREQSLRPRFTWDDLSKKLSALDGMPRSEQLEVFGELAALLKSGDTGGDNGAVATALSFLRGQGAIALGLQSALFNVTVGALAAAGTPEAQAAAIQVYQDPSCPTTAKGAILSSLTTMQAATTSSTQDFLSTEMNGQSNQDLAQGAAYALGASLQATPSQAATAQISDGWTQAVADNSISQEMALLDAMGNSGLPTYLPTIETVINGANSALQAKALFALRFIPGDEPLAILQAHLQDPNPQLSQASAAALSARR